VWGTGQWWRLTERCVRWGWGQGRGWRIGGRKWRMRGLRLLCLAWQGHRIMVKSVLKQCELAAAAGSAEGVEKETALPGVAGS
jgi:hypothetical protein